MLILKTLKRGSAHGWSISQQIQEISDDVLQVGQGSLYPALYRLEKKGWVVAEWAVSDAGRRARFYSLTTQGRKQLEVELAEWRRFSGAVTAILQHA